ncbi:peptidyl-prolyl cis-trans isomerase B (cyclophilin B) [Streptoalloteichus hindustanus]|uniref:Peptidyl-prolyl cis-trans isomerase n=1 Tax=Streptoalloteichus hindustanus TaxID=2017 RepID=A0A1M5HBE8_STRHI|nr:peptidyl-prolyl cis-trans isomerase B (cyclophilin B) [Streptoalloteichus hindustanus]
MPSNEQRRQNAKRKLERQLERRAQRAKRRRLLGVVSAIAATVVVAGGVYYLATRDGKTEPAAQSSESSAPPEGKTTGGPCAYLETPGEKAAKAVGMPDDPNPTPNQGTTQVTLKTDQGDVPLTLDRAKAPCTTQSFVHLAKAKYFDKTSCHRLTTTQGLKVLQCGDPSGTGSGGPGYSFKDETKPDMKYTRGTLAMANAGPNTNGSQFFIVYGDSQLPPNYTVFGSVGEDGLKTVDKVANAGPEAGARGEGDGKPKLPITINEAVVAN